ncbi:MAG: bifunctional diaminohydroxyphosphoribosylaminopyrimidine deaminase/5-amino-6-(5-phosphoribosylamino)uracil reductase RibD [Cyclobacteriaceae bacterium]|nr:bifunctional diaminohydroxyphosphoribosylaminopyrimidine deaminase/5-amino-6-(5-phosphoribosylamino)uracil reductase RibD [Cyclobacteriaceae bacterium]
MLRALELAQLGVGAVSPNPRVGCVIVADGRIIGEGWHQKYGEAHAEVNAIRSVSNQNLLKSSTVYVNLEPCAHFGKTPPCADLLVQHQVKKVVISNLDVNPLVAGKGIEKLRSAGIEVLTGILEQQGEDLNQRFFTFIKKKRPYIILKWAQTADGFLARSNFDSKWISNQYSRQLVHKWRSEEDAVLVGTNTAAHDNPSLTVRDWSGRNPKRVVIDRFMRLPQTLHLFDQSVDTVCYNLVKQEERSYLVFAKLSEKDFIKDLINDLYARDIQSVIVEGGAQTLQLFLEGGWWDEARVFYSRKTFTEGVKAPLMEAIIYKNELVFDDELLTYKPK